MSVRTLPLRVTPLPGEALDSWLEAVAARHHARMGDLLHHVGISDRTRRWLVQLHQHELHSISTATGVTPDVVNAMTLQRFSTVAEIDQTSHRQWSPSQRNRSRFCPQCLAASGGRWQLAWRSQWSFACTTHNCLLADDCVSCGRFVRTDPHRWGETPRPGRCANRRRSEQNQPSERCDADLAAQPVIGLPLHHPILAAQHIVSGIINENSAAFGVYSRHPCTADAALIDIRYLARLFLSIRSRDMLRRELDPQLARIYLGGQGSTNTADIGESPTLGDETARSTGTAIAVAIAVLQSTDIAVAGQKMHWLIGKQRLDTRQGTITTVPHITEVLNAIRIKAFLPHLSAFGQLRYRATTPMPTTPGYDSGGHRSFGSFAAWVTVGAVGIAISPIGHALIDASPSAVLRSPYRRSQDPVVHVPRTAWDRHHCRADDCPHREVATPRTLGGYGISDL